MWTGPKGAPLPGQYSVALLEKGLPFPAKCALSWLSSGTLRVTELTKQPTSAASWRFNLKARPGDETGESFAVHVRNDSGRAALLDAFVADARLRRPTKVFLQGRVFSFDAPTEGATLTGLHIEVLSSQDIRLATPMIN